LFCCACPTLVFAQSVETLSTESEAISEYQSIDYFSDDSLAAETSNAESPVSTDHVISDEVLATTPIQNSHPGLLGKRYFRASYTHRKYD
jgi:hypothetical protein